MKCEYCNNEHDGSYGSGRFCNISCSKGYSSKAKRVEINEKVSKTLKERYISKQGIIYCEKCGKEIDRYIKSGRLKTCNECKRKVEYKRKHPELNDLLKLSTRTIRKVIRRMKLSCVLCGWREDICDLHHIEYKSNGGNNDVDNLVYVCPNCHRLIHNKPKNFDIKLLSSLSLKNTAEDWRKYYCINMGKSHSGDCERL